MREITGRERFMKAIRREQPDRVPIFDFLFQKDIYQATIGRRPQTFNARDAIECTLAFGLDAACIPPGTARGWEPTLISAKVYIDEWGTTYQSDEAAWPIDAPVGFPIKDSRTLAAYKAPDPTAPGRIDEMAAALDLADGRVAVLGSVNGPLTTAWLIMGPTAIMYNFYDNPQLVKDVFRLSNENRGQRMGGRPPL